MFQDRLKELREEYRLNQGDMAKKLNISTSAYGYYEQGRNEPSIETIKKISETFNVSTDYLLGLTDIKNSTKLSENDISLTYEELGTISYLKESGLLGKISTRPRTNLERLERIWDFVQNEINIEKTQD